SIDTSLQAQQPKAPGPSYYAATSHWKPPALLQVSAGPRALGSLRQAAGISSSEGVLPIKRSTIAAALSGAIVFTFVIAALRAVAIDCSAAASLSCSCASPMA